MNLPPPSGPPPGYGRDASGAPVQPYYPYRQGAGNPPPGYYPPPGAPQRTTSVEGLPPDEQPEQGPRMDLPPQFQRQLVDYLTTEPAGTIIIDTPHTFLYLMLR